MLKQKASRLNADLRGDWRRAARPTLVEQQHAVPTVTSTTPSGTAPSQGSCSALSAMHMHVPIRSGRGLYYVMHYVMHYVLHYVMHPLARAALVQPEGGAVGRPAGKPGPPWR